MNYDSLMPVEHGKMDHVTAETRKRFNEGTCFSMQIHIRKNNVAEFKELKSQSVSIALTVLVEEPDFFHRGQQPMGRALWILCALADIAQ